MNEYCKNQQSMEIELKCLNAGLTARVVSPNVISKCLF